MPKPRETISPIEAFTLWEEHYLRTGKPAPVIRYLYRQLVRYEGLVAYRDSENKWRIYKDTLLYYLEFGWPDLEIMQPVMTLAAGLRYLHKFGVSPNYKLRELKKDLPAKWIKKGTGTQQPRISRSHLNKFLKDWNGN